MSVFHIVLGTLSESIYLLFAQQPHSPCRRTQYQIAIGELFLLRH